MSRLAALLQPVAVLCGLVAATALAKAGEPDLSGIGAMPPYKMVRTLEYVQDSVVAGDHAAVDMQTYLLQAIDKRLRAADTTVFEDSRNADAALIYAMSGGNPDTLRLLTSRDIAGHFDHELTNALLAYFSGQPETARRALVKIEPEFHDTDLGAYVSLVAANAEARKDAKKALKLYDWVRLLAPGSILEESALRRSIDLASQLKDTGRGFDYSRDYILRFIHSPYAGQFADLFVRLVVENTDAVTQSQIVDTLDGMDRERQAEIYLRIARAAAIEGKLELARASAVRAGQLSRQHDAEAATLAGFYQGVADVPSPEVHSASTSLKSVPDDDLSKRDQALRQAALAVAKQVTAAPGTVPQPSGKPKAKLPGSRVIARLPIRSQPLQAQEATRKNADKALTDFLEAKREKLKAIDDLLKKATE